MKECHRLVHETKAIEPVDLSILDQENVEFVPGKLVAVRKAGPNGGKKKCRAVVCGNMLSSDLDPTPGSLYASGADGILVLIRATLAYSIEMDWGIGLAMLCTVLGLPLPIGLFTGIKFCRDSSGTWTEPQGKSCNRNLMAVNIHVSVMFWCMLMTSWHLLRTM